MNPATKLKVVLALIVLGYCIGYIIGEVMDAIDKLTEHTAMHAHVLAKVTRDVYGSKSDTLPHTESPCEGCE